LSPTFLPDTPIRTPPESEGILLFNSPDTPAGPRTFRQRAVHRAWNLANGLLQGLA